MKKLLLGSAAIALGVAGLAGSAQAGDGVSLSLSGHSKTYLAIADQDTDPANTAAGVGTDARDLDLLRETEIHFSGETTLDNGLTVGVHVEADIDNSDSDGNAAEEFDTEESYAYFSGAWGRVNVGKEDGAAYLLQVSAPSADSNVDGLRQYVQPVNYTLAGSGAATEYREYRVLSGSGLLRLDYDQAIDGYDNKITYFTPVFNGFQAGVSYTPDLNDAAENTRGQNGVNSDDNRNQYGDTYSVAARYEGEFDQLGITLGGGYTTSELEEEAVGGTLDDRTAWNVGLDLDWGPFGLGVAYTEDDLGIDADADRDTLVIGVDYTTGPFKLGASYYDQDQSLTGLSGVGAGPFTGIAGGVTGELETQRFTGGVVYTYGPGLTFRGSLSFVEHDMPTAATDGDIEATSVLLGTQINF